MNTARFDLTDLRLFLLVVEHGSLTRGARAAHLAPASASERIRGMEAALGAPLLERTRGGMRATAAGAALARHARTIAQQFERMRGELRAYATGLKGRVRLLSNTAALATFLPERVGRFLAAHPDLAVDVDERPSAEIVAALAEDRADLGIAADIADLGGLQRHLLARDTLVVVAAAGHRAAARRSVSFRDIAGEDFVGLADAALEQHLSGHAARLGRELNYRARLRGVLDLGQLIEARAGIAILPRACAAQLRRPGLVLRPLAEAWARRGLYLCARDLAQLTPQAEALARVLMEGRGTASG